MITCYDNMNDERKAYEIFRNVSLAVELRAVRLNPDLIEAIHLATPIVRNNIKCDRCGRARAVELSDTGFSYCKRCYKAATDSRTPY